MVSVFLCVILLSIGLSSAAPPPQMTIGEKMGSKYKLLRFNSPNYGNVPGVRVSMSDNDPKRPAVSAIDGNIYSTAATTGGCNPCTLLLRLPNITFINRITIWNVRSPPPEYETIVWERFRNIQVEISLDMNEPNMTDYGFTYPPIQKWVSPVYHPSPLRYTGDPSVALRSIEIDLTKRSGGGVLGNTIRIRRIAESIPSADSRQLNIADIDIYGVQARTCKYSVWSSPVPDDLMCYRDPFNPVVRFSQTRTILQDPNYGLTGCDQELLRESFFNDTRDAKECIVNQTSQACQYSWWSDWTQCSAILCGSGTRTRTRSIINVDSCVPTGELTFASESCQSYTQWDCPVSSPDPCVHLWDVPSLRQLPNFALQKCSNGTWAASETALMTTDSNSFNWVRFPGTLVIRDSFVVTTDFTVGQDLIVEAGAELRIRAGAYLRVIGNLYVHENATVFIRSAALTIGGSFNVDGTVVQSSLSALVMFTNAAFGKKSAFDITELPDYQLTKVCEWLDTYSPVALFAASSLSSVYSTIVHPCSNISTLGNLTFNADSTVLSLYIKPPPPPVQEQPNLTPILIGSIVGGIAFLIFVVAAIVLTTGIHRDPYDQLAESQAKGKGSNYLMMV